MIAEMKWNIGNDIEAVAEIEKKRCVLRVPEETPRPSKVRFDLVPKYYLVPNDRTCEEIDRCWWTQSEIRGTKRACQWISNASRKQGYMEEIMDAVALLLASKMYRDVSHISPMERSSPLLPLTRAAASRLVRQSSKNFSTLRGLESQVCGKIRQHSRPYRARICRMQRLPGMNDEYLRRISQSFTRFHRIMARILGEADTIYLQSDTLDIKPMDPPAATANKDNGLIIQNK